MNSPFIGQQVGNRTSFTLTHYLADLFAMHPGPRSIPLCIQHHIQLTSLSFQVSRPSHSWVTAISIFFLENTRSWLWVSSKFEVTMWVKHSIDSHPFRSMSISHPIPEILLFQNLTLKIQSQGHRRSEHWKSQHGSNILWTHIPFIPCQSAMPFITYNFFKICPWKSKVKVMGEGNVESHNMGPTFYRLTSFSFYVNRTSHSCYDLFKIWPWKSKVKVMVEVNIESHIPFFPCQWVHPFLRYSIFKIWPWKSKVKVMGEGSAESHNMGPTFYRLTSVSFHVNRPSKSWDTAFSKFDLENPRSRSWVRWTLKVTTWVQHSIDSHRINSMSIGHPIPEMWLFKNLTLKIQGQGHGWGECWKSQSGCNILMTHIPFVPYQSTLSFQRYSVFKIWPWKSKVMVKWPWCCTTTGLDNSIEPLMA